MLLTVKLPSIVDDGRLDWALKLLKKPADGLKLDFGAVREISPAGFAILCCLFDSLIEQKRPVASVFVRKKFKNMPVIKNLVNIKNYSALPEPGIQNVDDSSLILKGLTTIDVLVQERLSERFGPILGEGLLYDCILILNELMQNARDHSNAERFYIYAGPWKTEFHIGVLDMGVSISAKMEQKYLCNDDLEYLELALKEGTTTRRKRTGGVGLSYFFHFLKRNGGKLTIVSRFAQVRRYFQTRRSQKNILKDPLRGTWCFARFPLEVKK